MKEEKIELGELVSEDVERTGPSGDGEFVYIDISCIDRSSKRIVNPKTLLVEKAPSRAKQVLQTGDVLVSMTRPNLNAIALVESSFDGAIGSTGFHVLRPSHADSSFLYYLVQTREFIESLCLKVQGALYPAVRPADISSFCLPPFSLANQRRIVAKIEELFSEIDAGVASLKTARAQLGVYRQSLLKQAFEGKLTEKWRDQNPDQLEPAEQLLARIRSEREARYQQQLTDWQTAVEEWEAGGKEGKKPGKPKKLKEVELITVGERKELKTLPEHWIYFRFGELISVKSGEGLTASQMKGGSFPVYGGNGVCGFHNKYLYMNSRLIIGRVGAKCGVIHITKPNSWVTDNALVGDFLVQSFDPIFYQLLLGFLDLNKLSVSTAQPVVSGAKLNPLPLPTPSLPEQQEIVRILEEQFTAIEQNEAEIDAALQRAEALRQSILKKAFAGKLVPQDPNDEPASVLLERIRAERESAEAELKAKEKASKKAVKTRATKKSIP